MTSRSILQVFEDFQKARLTFSQTIADLALRPQNVQIMKNANVLDLLKPLINDIIPSVRQCASIALGRLVHNDSEIATELIETGLLPILLQNASSGNKYQKTAVLFVLRSICKHNERMAEIIVKSGGLQTFIFCLEDFELSVKESAAWGVGYIARHSKQMAQECVNQGVLPLLMLCLQEPELSVKQIATSAITDIAKHTEDLAMCVVDAGIAPYLVKNLHNSDEKLKKQSLAALSAIARHSIELAEVVVESEIFPTVLQHLSHPCPGVRQNAAAVVRDIAKQSQELTQLVVNSGGIAALLEIILQPATKEPESRNDARLPCVTALGFIAGHSAQLAMTVIGCRTVQSLTGILNGSTDDALLSAVAWTISQIGRHSPEHAKAIASTNIFQRLVELYESPKSSVDLKSKCHNALKLCLQNCLLVSALEPLLFNAPPEILKYVLGQYSKVSMRKSAVSSVSTKTYAPNNLEITGNKINLTEIKQEKRNKIFPRKNLVIESAEQEEPNIIIKRPCQIQENICPKKPPLYVYKNCLKTNTTEYKNTEILSKVLRQIKETSKVEDFEKILRNLCQSDNFLNSQKEYKRKNKTDEVLEYFQRQNIYDQFFGQHYEYLSEIRDNKSYPESILDKVEEYSPHMMTVLRETSQNNEEMQTEIIQAVVKDELSIESESATDIAAQPNEET
ncbi:sperm-associated antigen 6-like [Sitophilus oryzae]|uniref:Sperm-associated antigen 6-like n=1 Tax=Sitophilus oryzae TaxID=7048 RepID=A0A6J2Y9K4_SITOR|nr:sperm-associated antigen 6-like [Sitophilus oryzae]